MSPLDTRNSKQTAAYMTDINSFRWIERLSKLLHDINVLGCPALWNTDSFQSWSFLEERWLGEKLDLKMMMASSLIAKNLPRCPALLAPKGYIFRVQTWIMQSPRSCTILLGCLDFICGVLLPLTAFEHLGLYAKLLLAIGVTCVTIILLVAVSLHRTNL